MSSVLRAVGSPLCFGSSTCAGFVPILMPDGDLCDIVGRRVLFGEGIIVYPYNIITDWSEVSAQLCDSSLV